MIACQTFVEFFQGTLRQPFFTGFLTLSGFLLSATTFIIIQMKKELYDHPKYVDDMAALRTIDSTADVFRPLRELSRLLIGALTLSVVTSASQFTLGIWGGFWGAVACCTLAAATFVVVLASLHQMRRNLSTWFDFAQRHMDERIEKINAPPEKPMSMRKLERVEKPS